MELRPTDDPRVLPFTPLVLSQMGRAVVEEGQWLGALSVTRESIGLRPISDHQIVGDSTSPNDWRVRAQFDTPNGRSRVELLSYEGVVHVSYATRPSAPWVGIPPWMCSPATSKLLAGLEKRQSEEASGTVAHLLPVPSGLDVAKEGERSPLGQLKADIKAAKGGTAMVETTASGFEQGTISAPRSDWTPRRIGAKPPAELIELRAAELSVLRSIGVPDPLYMAGSGSTAAQQAFRQFIATAFRPFVRWVEAELRDKLEMPNLTLSIRQLQSSDVVHQSRVVATLVKAGVELEQAMELGGLSGQ